MSMLMASSSPHFFFYSLSSSLYLWSFLCSLAHIYTFLFLHWYVVPGYIWIHNIWYHLHRWNSISLFYLLHQQPVMSSSSSESFCVIYFLNWPLVSWVSSAKPMSHLLPSCTCTPWYHSPLLYFLSPLLVLFPYIASLCWSCRYHTLLLVIAFYIKPWLYHAKINRSKTN